MHFSLVRLNPEGQAFASFDDVVYPLLHAFHKLGFIAEVRTNSLHPTAKNILFGVNQYTRLPLEHIPRGTIIFNLEQLSSGDIWFTPQYVRLLREFPVWDYSVRNCEGLQKRFGVNAQHVRLGYVEEMSRIPTPTMTPGYDVLFYGSLNGRRLEVLHSLQGEGARLFLPKGVLYGEMRDRAVADSALALNIHYHLPAALEVVRLGYLWANKVAVVSELREDTEIPTGLETACVYAAYEKLVPECLGLSRDKEALRKQGEEGFRAFSGLTQVSILEKIVGRRKVV